MSNKTLLVAHREYLENVRTKTFWIGIFIVPLLLGAMVGGSALLKRLKEVQSYAVLDLGNEGLAQRAEREFRQGDLGAIFQAMREAPELADLRERLHGAGAPQERQPTGEQLLQLADWANSQPPELLERFGAMQAAQQSKHVPLSALGIDGSQVAAARKALNERVQSGALFAYFVLGQDPAQSLDDFEYVCNNLTDASLRSAYEAALSRLVQRQRIKAAGITPSVAAHIQAQVSFSKKQLNEAGTIEDVKKEQIVDKWAPAGFVYMLFLAIMSITSLLLTNTVEEKSNRIIEVLLSSVSPGQLMHGKILGIAATGLTIICTWVVFGLLAAAFAPSLLGDGSSALLSGLFTAIQNRGYLLSFVFYFLAGYLLYAAILVAIGSVCNSLKEAQNLMQPVMILLMVPLIAMVFVTQEPNGTVARVLSFVPLFTPFTMMNRAGGPPETWEYVATSALLLLSIWLAFVGAGKIFRVGVLMTGNPPKLKDILAWLKEK